MKCSTFIAIFISIEILVWACSASAHEPDLSLTYLSHLSIKNEAEGLLEPSGIALSSGNQTLWAVSDDTEKIFKLGPDGMLSQSFGIPNEVLRGLEGLVENPTGTFLVTVREDGNEFIRIRIAGPQVLDRKALSSMDGFDRVRMHFADEAANNKGLEGVAWNTTTGTIFALKEGKPGLLMQVSPDLKKLLDYKFLGNANGFHDPDTEDDELDFSGICYDPTRDRFWIVSDKAKRLFLYDYRADRVVQSFALGYGVGGVYREIEKAEGVAIDLDSRRLYIVSDAEAALYVFEVGE